MSAIIRLVGVKVSTTRMSCENRPRPITSLNRYLKRTLRSGERRIERPRYLKDVEALPSTLKLKKIRGCWRSIVVEERGGGEKGNERTFC